MILDHHSENGPISRAAKRALETGNANYILIWLPEESENTLKNLLEKTCCENSTRKNMHNRTTDWYFESVNRLHCMYGWPNWLGVKFEGSDEKTIALTVERAFESGNFEEINNLISNAHSHDVRERFHNVMIKRNYAVDDVAAGRAYVSSFIAFIAYLHSLSSGSPGKSEQ